MQVATFIFLQITAPVEGYILDLREVWYPSWIIYAVILSVGLVGLVRVLNHELIPGVFACLFVRPTSSTSFRETMSLLGKTFWFLLLNYALISTIFIFLILRVADAVQPSYILFLPLALFFHPIIALLITSLFTGELRRLRENIQIISMTFQMIGLLLIPLTVILILNPTYFLPILYVSIAIYIAFTGVRLFRGMSYAIQNKIPWYYIILYLCSLEILPVGIFLKLVA